MTGRNSAKSKLGVMDRGRLGLLRCRRFRLGLRLVGFRVVSLLLELAFLRFGDQSRILRIVEFGSGAGGSRRSLFFATLGNLERELGVLCNR